MYAPQTQHLALFLQPLINQVSLNQNNSCNLLLAQSIYISNISYTVCICWLPIRHSFSGHKVYSFVSVTSSDLPMKPQILLHAFAPMAHDAKRGTVLLV